jgi:hypothetical protein
LAVDHNGQGGANLVSGEEIFDEGVPDRSELLVARSAKIEGDRGCAHVRYLASLALARIISARSFRSWRQPLDARDDLPEQDLVKRLSAVDEVSGMPNRQPPVLKSRC